MADKKLVLPDRIELSTSPLPRECSTTELRQREAAAAHRLKAAPRRAETATRAGGVQGCVALAVGAPAPNLPGAPGSAEGALAPPAILKRLPGTRARGDCLLPGSDQRPAVRTKKVASPAKGFPVRPHRE